MTATLVVVLFSPVFPAIDDLWEQGHVCLMKIGPSHLHQPFIYGCFFSLSSRQLLLPLVVEQQWQQSFKVPQICRTVSLIQLLGFNSNSCLHTIKSSGLFASQREILKHLWGAQHELNKQP